MTIHQLLEKMWKDYCDLNPAALKIYNLFTAEGEKVLNDHIALRTFQHPRLGLKKMAQTFINMGYRECDEYFFKEKKLYARHYEHDDEKLPKIFISELELGKISPELQKQVNHLIEQVPDSVIQSESFTYSGRPWKMSHRQYLEMAKESEYASWVAAHGFRPNHFTVNVNALQKLTTLQSVNAFLEKHQVVLNKSGGTIKGTPAEFLEQSSTMASEIEVRFEDGLHKVPGCYYEFAKRYKLPNGKYYQGFIAASADKIFESTDRQTLH